MRLLDRLLTERFKVGLADRDEVLSLLKNAQLVVADNVADYYMDEKGKDVPRPSDFPNVMLPFEYTFIEMRWRKRDKVPSVLEESGVLFSLMPAKELQVKDSVGVQLTGAETKWHMHGYLFVKYQGKDPFLMNRFIIGVGEDGRVADDTGGGQIGFAVMILQEELKGFSPEETRRLSGALITTTLMPSLLALSFMHCRNVKVKTEIPPAPLSKKHQRKTGRPLLRYHVLQIDHMKQVLEREGGASTQGLKKALHICRGHFKHYGRDGKGLLFGKYTATVWIPMHARGSAEEGVVMKDYDVK